MKMYISIHLTKARLTRLWNKFHATYWELHGTLQTNRMVIQRTSDHPKLSFCGIVTKWIYSIHVHLPTGRCARPWCHWRHRTCKIQNKIITFTIKWKAAYTQDDNSSIGPAKYEIKLGLLSEQKNLWNTISPAATKFEKAMLTFMSMSRSQGH